MGAAFFCRSLIPLSRSLQKCKCECEKILLQNIQHGKKKSEFDSEFVEKVAKCSKRYIINEKVMEKCLCVKVFSVYLFCVMIFFETFATDPI
jgi:hypothetical protein